MQAQVREVGAECCDEVQGQVDVVPQMSAEAGQAVEATSASRSAAARAETDGMLLSVLAGSDSSVMPTSSMMMQGIGHSGRDRRQAVAGTAGVDEHVGFTLRAAREAAGVSLAQMAARTHFTRGHLSNVERGARTATPDVVLAYERTLEDDDVDRRSLLTGLASTVVAPMVMSEAMHGAFTAALAAPVGAEDLSTRLVGDLVRLQQYMGDVAVLAPAARMMTVYGKTLPANDGGKGAVLW